MDKRLLQLSAVFILFLIFISCRKYDNGYSKVINIELKSVKHFTINNGRFTATLYGYDPMVQDLSASKITEQTYESKTLPVNIKLAIPKNPDSKIAVRNEHRKMEYYLNIEWDANNNQKYDKGDIMLEYDKQFPMVDLNKKNHSFYVYQY